MAAHVVDRPLRLGEVLAETVRVYGERIWAALALGAVYTGAVVVGYVVHPLAFYALGALAFGTSFAAATRVVAGDSLAEAWSQVAVRLPAILVLCATVALPVVITVRYGLALLVGAVWLAFSGFAIPVAMLERGEEGESLYRRLSRALDRSMQLARVEYLHALGVVAALFIAYIVLAVLLGGLLRGFADNSAAIAEIITGIVLWPVVFLGLSVLYFDQRTRRDSRAAPAAE